MPKQLTRAWIAVSLLSIGLTYNASANLIVRTVALSDQQVPGAEPGTAFERFFTPIINRDGRVAFQASAAQSDGSFSPQYTGIWSDRSNTLELAVHPDDAATSTNPEVGFTSFSEFGFNDNGQIAFIASVEGVNAGRGVWIQDPQDGLRLLTAHGRTAPELQPGETIAGIQSLSFNNQGQVRFKSYVRAPRGTVIFDPLLWIGDREPTVSLITRAGDPSNPATPGIEVALIESLSLINDLGETPFSGPMRGQGIDDKNNLGIWNGRNSSGFELSVQKGDTAPGTSATFKIFGDRFSINRHGHIAFYATLDGPNIDSTNNRGLWLETGSGLQLIARAGDPVPGREPGVTYSGVGGGFMPTHNSGYTAFEAGLTETGTNPKSVGGIMFGHLESIVHMIARIDGHAPGTAPGVVFRPSNSFRAIHVNSAGTVVFDHVLDGPGVNNTNHYGIWAADSNGEVGLIVRTGDLFDVDDDPLIEDLRTIEFMNINQSSNGEDGRPSSLNDANQLAMAISFTDGTEGVFVFTVPEPGSLALLLPIVMPTLVRRRMIVAD